jgi:hypothetical protein
LEGEVVSTSYLLWLLSISSSNSSCCSFYRRSDGRTGSQMTMTTIVWFPSIALIANSNKSGFPIPTGRGRWC